MKEAEFLEELSRIKEDVDGRSRLCSPCSYFHGRESLFSEEQLKKAVVFFLECLEMKSTRRAPAGQAILHENEP